MSAGNEREIATLPRWQVRYPLPTWPQPAWTGGGRRARGGAEWGRGQREPSGAAPPRAAPPPPASARSIPDWSGSSAAARRPRREAAPGTRHFRRVGAVGWGRLRGASGQLWSGRAQGCSGGRRRRPCGLGRQG